MVCTHSFTITLFLMTHLRETLELLQQPFDLKISMHEGVNIFLVHYCYNGLCWGCSWTQFLWRSKVGTTDISGFSKRAASSTKKKRFRSSQKKLSRTNRQQLPLPVQRIRRKLLFMSPPITFSLPTKKLKAIHGDTRITANKILDLQ